MSELGDLLEIYKSIVDESFRSTSFNNRQNKAAGILSEAQKHLSTSDFKELEKYVFEKLV